LFRNWYIAAAAKAQNNWNNPNLHHSEECTIEEKQGALYRLIDKSGDAYLPDNEVRELLKRLPLDGKAMGRENGLQWAGWRLDMGSLKQYAKKCVQRMLVNKSRLSKDGLDALGITYLTCVTVEDDELPWGEELKAQVEQQRTAEFEGAKQKQKQGISKIVIVNSGSAPVKKLVTPSENSQGGLAKKVAFVVETGVNGREVQVIDD
jgi:hypothetical protein